MTTNTSLLTLPHIKCQLLKIGNLDLQAFRNRKIMVRSNDQSPKTFEKGYNHSVKAIRNGELYNLNRILTKR